MRPFTRQDLARLLADREAPCVTLAMPTHRHHPETQQDPIRYANLARDVATALEKKYGKRHEQAAEVLARVERLGAEGPEGSSAAAFWAHQRDGLAVFAAPGFFAWYRVPITLRDITVVSDSFHVKPLLPLLYDDMRYNVLALTKNEVKLYEGNGEHVSEVSLDGVPRSLTEALGEEFDDSRSGVTFHGGAGAGGPIHHGAGKGSDEEKTELRRFFRAVDRAVSERYSKPSGLPLILAAVDYYHPLYREVSHDPNLADQGIAHDPKSLGEAQLREKAWAIFTPLRERRLSDALEEFGSGRARRTASDDLAEVSSAAVAGRVKTLVLEEKRRIWGRLNRDTGEVSSGGAQGNPDDVDVLAELAELAITHGGDVLIAPAENMPSPAGLAAVYRY